MIIRMSRWQVTVPGADEAVRRWDEELLPTTYASVPGLLAAYFLGRQGSQERVAMTLWQDQESYRKAQEAGLLADISTDFAHLFQDGAFPVPADYDVLAARTYQEAPL